MIPFSPSLSMIVLPQQISDKSTHILIDALGMMLRVDNSRSISYSTSPLRSNAAGDF